MSVQPRAAVGVSVRLRLAVTLSTAYPEGQQRFGRQKRYLRIGPRLHYRTRCRRRHSTSNGGGRHGGPRSKGKRCRTTLKVESDKLLGRQSTASYNEGHRDQVM